MKDWGTADSLSPVLENLSSEFVVPEVALLPVEKWREQ